MGSPKGVTLSHRGIVDNGRFFGDGLRYTKDDRVCVPMPFHHCFGMGHGHALRHLPRRDDDHPRASTSSGRSRGTTCPWPRWPGGPDGSVRPRPGPVTPVRWGTGHGA
ncbi:AMP-binding protein [Streptomyces sp. NPDC001604]|uniref:AMP-binding protein n=1 Tax=Streptomyces sp. NPDC001604 TaxID=3364593 RepID=UPI0036C99558